MARMTGIGQRRSVKRSMTGLIARALILYGGFGACVAHAEPATDTVAQFYRGKQITVLVAGAIGGNYDMMARLMIRHLGNHIPGRPNLIVQNNPAGGGLILANTVYNTAPRDGTVIALPLRNIMTAPISRPDSARFDLARFTWIGNLASEIAVSFAWHTAAVKTIDDLLQRDLVIGVQAGADTDLTPRLYNATIGSHFKPVRGYLGPPQIVLAMERGEVEGIGDWSWGSFKAQRYQWLKEGKVRMLLQGSLKPHPELPGVPSALDYARSDLDRQVLQLFLAQKEMARPVFAPPEVPAERVAALRAAFMALATDAEFLRDAAALHLEPELSPAAALAQTAAMIGAAPASVKERLLAALAP